ncbi:hypothetical protein B0J17DRAFT_102744 [Rhizoctonia solani]|nr:hypothetical protein B0J17DRAFT_102744 [Rhizoctonia solani]
MFTRFARKLSLIRRRSVDVMANPEENSSRPSFTVERRPGTAPGGAKLERRATMDITPSRSTTYRSHEPAFSPAPPSRVLSSEELFAPIDPQLRASRLINAQLSPPPRIPDLTLPGDRNSWAASLHRKASAKSPGPLPTLSTDDLLPPPPIGGRHPDSPHSIPRWGIQTETEKSGPLLIEGASPTDESPVSTSKGVLTIANPDIGESEVEEVAVYGNEVALYAKGKDDRPASVDGLKALRAQLEATASPESRRNRELPVEPGVKGTKPLVVRKDLSRSPSPVKALGQESPLKRSGRDSPVKRGGRESPVKRGRREHSPVKPIRRSEPLKDHSAVNGADVQKSHGFRPVGGAGRSLRSSAAIGSTTSVDAIQGDDDAEFGAKSAPQEDPTGRQRILRSRASTDSIGKMHVITPKTSLQKIRVRVVSNPPPVEISKESSPVKDDPPPAPERTKSTKTRPRSGYTGAESRHSIYGTATSESSEVPTSPSGPRKRISTVGPDAPPRHPSHSKSLDTTSSKVIEPSTPYLTPTGDAPLHPFSEKPVAYQNMMPPISVMRFETVSPPPEAFTKRDAMSSSKMVFADSKGAWMDSPTMSPPKAPFMNDEFSVSKEKLAAREEFTKHHKRESTADSDRRRARDEAKEERARVRAERAERAEYERAERERAEYERVERERQERERAKQEARARAERERLEQERREQERLEQERLEQERLEQERLDREREYAERARAERERVRAAQRQKEEQERIERIARERDRERVEQERLERERQELERERIDRERAEQKRLDWERLERERLMEEEMRRREPPALLPTNSGRRTRHEVYEEREIPITSPKEPRKSRRRSPNESRSTSPTSTVPPPPPKENQPIKSRPRAQTDAYVPPITNALPPPVQPPIEVIAGVPVLPQGTHVEVAQPFQPRPTSVNTIEAPSLKARDAWERERLDKGQSVMVPGGQRAVIPDIGSPRPAPDPRQRQPSNKVRAQTPLMSHSEPIVPPVSEYGPTHSSYSIPTFPSSRSHNPLPKPPTIDGPFPLHRPGQAYTNPNRQLPGQGRPSGARNPLPQPPRVSSYPLHHNVSPPRGPPPGAGR